MIELLAQENMTEATRKSGLFERLLHRMARRVLAFTPEGGAIAELPSGQRYSFGDTESHNTPVIKLNNYAVLRKAMLRGKLGFAESYMAGDIEISDLTALFRFFLRNEDRFAEAGRSFFKVRLPDRLFHKRRHNSRKNSRRNISAHYDLSNAFFALWLDPRMIYSSALYEDQDETLDEAQRNKIARIIELLDIRPGHNVLEIGCGWGALARQIAIEGRAHVTGITLSREQLVHCRDEAERLEIPDKCIFRIEDYRETEGTFDRIVSIEMIEAVGEEYWPEYFATLRDRLAPEGAAVIQAITMAEEHYDAYRNGTDFIQRYIFPGGMLPTEKAIRTHAEAAGLVIDHAESFGSSYAQTLREWRRRFEEAWPKIEKLGFDNRFRRLWRYYLTYCEAGFEEGVIDVGLYRLRRA
ncbi:MAG: class I SAM-dependent methyltransferase [Rhodobiaceae bacterium]|nr:class I SAM-dependent methyltransferase [Rhodobiaceae bacterium]MCC0049314.1 class I SAM-dependent methyltransferase [Rhodobiaceae bacterium]